MGEITSESRVLPDFQNIHTNGRVNLVIIEDSSNFVEITYGEHLLSGISTKIEDETLYIDDVNHCNWTRDLSVWPEVKIHVKSLKSIYCESSGSIVCENAITTSTFQFEVFDVAGSAKLNYIGDSLSIIAHTGATDITAFGTSNYLYCYNASYAPIDCSSLMALDAFPHNQGTGDIRLRASQWVYYQIFDWGNIYVYGNPSIKKWHDEGKGELIFQE